MIKIAILGGVVGERSVPADSPMLAMVIEPIGSHGGMSQFDQAFCDALVRQGVAVIWATCDETLSEASSFEVWTPFRGIYGSAPAWRRGVRYLRGLWDILERCVSEKRRRPVIVHQQFVTLFPAEWCFVLAARLFKIPCVLTPHDTVPFYMRKGPSRSLFGYFRGYDAIIAHARENVLALSAAVKNRKPVYYVPLGNLNQPSARAPWSRAEALSRLGISPASAVILFWGRIRKEKGLEYLIRAMPRVIDRIPDSVLLIAGSPGSDSVEPYEQLIDQCGIRAKTRARWQYIPDTDLPFYFRTADVVALPYTRVYQSAVVMTAYAFRRPVVASAVGGVKEQVQDHATGYLVPPGDVEALANALVKVLSDRNVAERMGENGYAWAEEVGNWDRIAAETVQIYREIWREKGNHP